MSNYKNVNDTKTNKRIIEEYEEFNKNRCSSVATGIYMPDKNNIYEWEASFYGPKDTSYKGGLFFLSIKFPIDYPEHGPEICFKTPIYHINVNPIKSNLPGAEPLGHISISTLKLWKPKYRMREVLPNIFALFYMVNPESAYGLERVDEFRDNRCLYENKIKYFTKKYANPIKYHINKNIDDSWDFSYDVK